jgi:hypothetical protein
VQNVAMMKYRRKHAATFLSMTVEGIRHLEQRGVLHPSKNLNGHYEFDPAELERVKAERDEQGHAPRLTRIELRDETADRRLRRQIKRDEEQAAKADLERHQLFLAQWNAEIKEQAEERRKQQEFERATLSERDVVGALGLEFLSDIRTLADRGRLRPLGDPSWPRYDRADVEKLRLEFEELALITVTAEQAQSLASVRSWELRDLAKNGVFRVQLDPLGRPRYRRDDVLAFATRTTPMGGQSGDPIDLTAVLKNFMDRLGR